MLTLFKQRRLAVLLMGFTAACTAVFATAAHGQDFSRSYRYGGGIYIPGSPYGGGGGTVTRDIVNVNAGVDVGGVLGCSGLDLRGLLQSVFDVGDIGSELKDYLKNRLATEALSLLYSQPGVSEVLNGMQALANARVSIQQERCNANEILADVTNQRLRSEGQELCLKEKSPAECEGSTLAEYVQKVSSSRRWTGDLHTHLCPSDPETGEKSSLCSFIPNFTYDVGARVGRQQPSYYSNAQIISDAREAALSCLQERAKKAAELIEQYGFAGASRKISSGEAIVSCGEASRGVANTPAGTTGSADAATGNILSTAQNGLSVAESCVLMSHTRNADGTESPLAIDISNLDVAIEQAKNMDLKKIVEAHVQCIIGRELHAHVDQRLVLLPAIEAVSAWSSLAQVFSTKAFIELNSARIRKLTATLVQSGGRENSKVCAPEQEQQGACTPSLNPQTIDTAEVLINQFKQEQQEALTELDLAENVAARINAVIENQEQAAAEGEKALQENFAKAQVFQPSPRLSGPPGFSRR